MEGEQRVQFYRRYVHDAIISPIKAKWNADWEDSEFSLSKV